MMLLSDLRPKPAGLLTYQPIFFLPPTSPSQSYDEFCADMMNAMSAAMGIPVELLEAANKFPNRARRRASMSRRCRS